MASKIRIALALGWLAFLVGFCLQSPTHGAGTQIVVIVNKANPITSLTLADAKKYFMATKAVWPSGKRVTVVMTAADAPERGIALHEIFKMSDADVSKYFIQAAFTGQIDAPPVEVGAAAQMKQSVAGNAGAIGYVMKGDEDDSVKAVLTIP
jgi:hypothetical protein